MAFARKMIVLIDFDERAFYNRDMESMQKLAWIADDMALETDESVASAPAVAFPAEYTLAGTPECPGPASPPAQERCQEGLPVYMAALPGGRRVPLLKSLLTSACERNCFYCPFRAGRDMRRVTFKPDEMAHLVLDLTRARVIQGAFISSAIAGGGPRTQDRLIDTAEILRKKLHYRGYLHLKLMPGAEADQIERAMQLADRVSVNLEAPNPERLALLAPQKQMMDELLRPLRVVESIRRDRPAHLGWNGHWPSTTTQFVVGAVGESDLELLQTVSYLYRKLHLARSYFSGFNPVQDTPFEDRNPTNPWREYRLYQASFLLRDYGFELEDMPFQNGGNLPVETDPKVAWARQNLEEAPLEVNRADRRELLKVPGFGPKAVEAIVKTRQRGGRLRSIEDLKALGIAAGRAAPFILLDGHRPARQIALF
jgi:predicted DNA-binding helix-hairpin-helix protein